MRRDPKLIRHFLLEIERTRYPGSWNHLCSEFEKWEYVRLLKETGWVEANGQHGSGAYEIVQLTPQGCDILDIIRKDEIWEAACAIVEAAGLEGNLDITIDKCRMLIDAILRERAQLN